MKGTAQQIALTLYGLVAIAGGLTAGIFTPIGICVSLFGSQVLSKSGDGSLNPSHPSFLWIGLFIAPSMLISMVGSAVTFVLPFILLYPSLFFTKETRRRVAHVRMLERRLKIISMIMDGDAGESQTQV